MEISKAHSDNSSDPVDTCSPSEPDNAIAHASQAIYDGSLGRANNNIFIKQFEFFFVVFTLVTTFLIYYFIPEKLAFLDFFFLPIILGGCYLRRRIAILAATLPVLTIIIFVILKPEAFLTEPNKIFLYLHIIAWGSFLILAAAVVGGLHEKLVIEVETIRELNYELNLREYELDHANAELKDYSGNLENKVKERTEELDNASLALREYSENLEAMVRERTEELEKSKESIEALKAKVEMALYSTMDSAVVKLLIEGRLRNEKRNVSILFSDLVGFSTYSEQTPPEIVIRDLNRYLADMEPILLTYHGHIDRYMGDGIMCEFGAPHDYATYRLMAVLAAIKMEEKMMKADYPWQMRIGISSGTTIIGLVGSKRQSYTAIGDVVNISARLQNASTPGRVLIDKFTYETVKQFINVRKKCDISTKDVINIENELRLEELHKKVLAEPDNPVNYYNIGQIHLKINEPLDAFKYFERAMHLDPNNTQFKLAYAEISLKAREYEQINIKGRRQRIEAFEVIGLRDPLEELRKVSQNFADKYRSVADLIQIPDDMLLPVEALDSSIGHGKMVAIFSYAIASHLGLSDKEKSDILHAGYVADIGKEIVPHHLLNRAGSLSPREMEIIKTHPVESVNTLRKMGYENNDIFNIISHSHESFNGTGYPDGLKGEDIPLGSRIVAVADSYDAMISWRPYRDPWERSVALDELAREADAGSYDSKIVSALIKVLL
ncbi:MAG: HD domain-containing protein [Proteobacteria bacterium]|nr:HD domain-containing protein [Pseudomonadota bacterium]